MWSKYDHGSSAPTDRCAKARWEAIIIAGDEALPVAALAAALPGAVDWLMRPDIRSLVVERRMMGTAVTCRCREDENGTLHVALESCQPGSVLVVETHPETRVASFGGLMAAYAMRKGLAGVVIDGHVRDLRELLAVAFPIWARDVTVGSPKKMPRGDIQVPIECGGVQVMPGDLVAGDADGVIVVPKMARDAALAAAREIVRWEGVIASRVSEGESLVSILGLNGEEPGDGS